jgi:hypothetical protein
MHGEPVDFRLPYMGAYFNQDDLMEFLNSSDVYVSTVYSPCGNYITAETADGMQLWFEEDKENPNYVCDFNVHFKSSTRIKLRLDGWTAQKSGGLSGLAYMWNEAGDTEFPLNLDVVDAGLFAEYESGEFTAQIAAFGCDVSLFPDLAAFTAADMPCAAESCIPIGTFPIHEDEENWAPSAHALLSGRIKSVQRCTNAYTGGAYYLLQVDCLGLKLDVLLNAADTKTEPVAGGYIYGVFYLTARLFVSDQDDCLTPCFAIETAKVINSLDSMDFRDKMRGVPRDGWELFAYPILPDGSILLIFQNNSVAKAGGEEGRTAFYRFLRYDENGTLVDKRQTCLTNGALHTAYYGADGHLHLVFQLSDSGDTCMLDLDDAEKPQPVYTLGENISRVITDAQGNILVGRDYSWSPEGASGLISLCNERGAKLFNLHSENYRCAELVLDSEDTLWGITEPILSLDKIVTADLSIEPEHIPFPLSGVSALAISKDGSHMFGECQAVPGKSRFFVLTRRAERYGHPVEVWPPLEIQQDCRTYGMCATAKDKIVFNIDGVLFLYRLENKRCDTLEDLGRIRIKKRTPNHGQYYSITLDPDARETESSLAHFVKPILLDMQELANESLTIAFSEARSSDAVSFIQAARNDDNYHLEIAVYNAAPDQPRYRIYALLDADFDTVYAAFKTVLVDAACPDLTEWVDYTDVAFGKNKKSQKPSASPEAKPQLPLDSPLEALNLSVRSHNRLAAAGIQTIGQLVSCSVEELAQVPRLGKRGLAEVLDALAKQGYELC